MSSHLLEEVARHIPRYAAGEGIEEHHSRVHGMVSAEKQDTDNMYNCYLAAILSPIQVNSPVNIE